VSSDCGRNYYNEKKEEAPIVSFQSSSDYYYSNTVYTYIVPSEIVVLPLPKRETLIDFERTRAIGENENNSFFSIAVARLPAKVVIILYPRMPLVSLRRIGRVTIGGGFYISYIYIYI
jgi:hypothetical protein